MLLAVTCTVTVTTPPDGIVTEPKMVVPVMLKPAVVAPPETWLPRLVALPNRPGSVSVNEPLVIVDGPALVITKLKVVVAPVATVVVFDSLLTPRLIALVTVPPTAAVVLPRLVVPPGSSTLNVFV